MMLFRHLDYHEDAPITELGPAALDALLDSGDLEDWAPLARAVLNEPHGEIADTVLRLCDAHPMYGTSELWRTFVGRAREGFRNMASLEEIRRRAGFTQRDLGERMGITQSDVSKLERRDDVLISTLRRYVEAVGGNLHIEVRLGGRSLEVTVGGTGRTEDSG